MNQAYKKQSGFTIIELTLSMAFIALLLLGIATLTLLISTTYTKGLTLRAVNEAGQLISSDIQRTLNTSRPADTLRVGDGTGGRICANNAVYAWNYAGSLTTGFNRFDTPGREVRMLRFTGDISYCQLQPSGTYKNIPSSSDSLAELLKAGDNTLAVQNLTFTESVVKDDDTQRMYEISLRLGSSDTSIIPDNGCEVPVSATDDAYCAVNTFRFTSRAGNRGVSNV